MLACMAAVLASFGLEMLGSTSLIEKCILYVSVINRYGAARLGLKKRDTELMTCLWRYQFPGDVFLFATENK